MSLSKIQQEFTVCTAQLINFAVSQGIGLTYGDAHRDERVHGAFGQKKSYSAKFSVHKKRLAVDFNVFVDGQYIMNGGHEAYKILGEEWKRIHPLARWGGDFASGDANHFSFEWEGYK